MYQIPMRGSTQTLDIPKEEINRLIEELEDYGITYEDSSPYLVVRTSFSAVTDLLRELRPDLKLVGSTIEARDRGWMNFIYSANSFNSWPDQLAISHFCKK